jgi:hypothetical protein
MEILSRDVKTESRSFATENTPRSAQSQVRGPKNIANESGGRGIAPIRIREFCSSVWATYFETLAKLEAGLGAY